MFREQCFSVCKGSASMPVHLLKGCRSRRVFGEASTVAHTSTPASTVRVVFPASCCSTGSGSTSHRCLLNINWGLKPPSLMAVVCRPASQCCCGCSLDFGVVTIMVLHLVFIMGFLFGFASEVVLDISILSVDLLPFHGLSCEWAHPRVFRSVALGW